MLPPKVVLSAELLPVEALSEVWWSAFDWIGQHRYMTAERFVTVRFINRIAVTNPAADRHFKGNFVKEFLRTEISTR
jgi:hypothetical protein